MDVIGLIKSIPAIFRANRDHNANLGLMLLGPIGHAKTSAGAVVAKVLTQITGEAWASHIREPMLVPYDEVRGMAIPQRTEAGQLVAEYTFPSILPPRDEIGHSVLVLDEFTKAGEDTVLALGNAVLSRRLGDTVIPKETFIIGTGNRAGVDKSKDMALPAHVMARFVVLPWQLTFRSWRSWAMAQRVHPLTIAYADRFEHKVFSGVAPGRNEAFLTPRSLDQADRLIRSWVAEEGRSDEDGYFPVDNTDLTHLLEGMIGPAGAQDLVAFAMIGQHLPQWSDIVRKPTKAAVPDMDGMLGPAALHATSCMISQRLDRASVASVCQYVARLPGEFQVPVLIRLGVDFPAEAASAGLIDVLLGSADLTAAAVAYEAAR